MNSGMMLGCLFAAGMLVACGPSPTFDWQGYSRDLASVHNKGGANREASAKRSKSPAIFGFGGWEGGNHMEKVVRPVSLGLETSTAQSIAYGQWPDVMEAIKRQHLEGHPVILIGYSAGCSDALRISHILDKAHVPVGLVLMDATYLGSGMFRPSLEGIPNVGMIPGNVYMVENYVTYSPFGGRNLTARDLVNPDRTKFRNIFINCAHLNLLLGKYCGFYAASIHAIINEYPGKH